MHKRNWKKVTYYHVASSMFGECIKFLQEKKSIDEWNTTFIPVFLMRGGKWSALGQTTEQKSPTSFQPHWKY